MKDSAHQSGTEFIEQIKAQSERGLSYGDLHPTLQQEVREHTKRAAAADKAVPFAKRAAQQGEMLGSRWKQLDGAQKVNAGMWGAGAVLGVFGTISAAGSSVARDENGKAHVMWSQVGVTLLQAAIAAGCAYMGVQAVHGRA